MEDTGWTWKGVPSLLLNSSYVGGVSRAFDAPPNTPLYTSFDTAFAVFGNGLGSSSVETDTLTYPTVTLNPLSYYRFQFKVCSFGIDTTVVNTPAGVDVSDYVQIEYKSNGGTYIKELKITGSNNLRWSYASNSIIKTASGSNTTLGLSRSIGTVGVDLPIGISQFSPRLTIVLNGSGESWFIDDVELIELRTLPVDLLAFTCEYKGDYRVITWSTASQTNCDYFALYSSQNCFEWSEIERVAGEGTTTNIYVYQYVDSEKCDGVIYYKLKQVDYDGNSQEFDPIVSKCSVMEEGDFEYINVLGQTVGEDYEGIKLKHYFK